MTRGVGEVTFSLVADGTTVVSETFKNGAAAQAAFTDMAIPLGSLASGALSGDTLTLSATLTVASTSAGSGFYGDLIIGDPPASAPIALPDRFAAAIAAFAPTAPGSAGPNRPVGPEITLRLAAPRDAAQA